MENSVDALKIAFAVMVFVIAITLSFQIISQAKSTADIVLYASDETNYYQYNDNNSEFEVDFSTVVATIYNYYTETMSVIVTDGAEEHTWTFDSENEEYANTAEVKKAIQDKLNDITSKLDINNTTKFKVTFSDNEYVGGSYKGPNDYKTIKGNDITDDGSQIQITPGTKKVKITFTKQ